MTIYTAISLHQPFASLIFVPNRMGKVNETRGRRCPEKVIGDHILIHAAKTEPQVNEAVDAICVSFFGSAWRSTLPRGQMIGSARVQYCRPMDPNAPLNGAAHPIDYICGNWELGRFHYGLLAMPGFHRVVPAIGQQGWFKFDLQNTFDLAAAMKRRAVDGTVNDS